MSTTSVLLGFGAAADDPIVAVVLLSISIGTLYLCLSAFWAVTIDITRDFAGTATGFLNMGANIGGTISPTLTPYLANAYNWETSLNFMAALCLLGGFCWLGVNPAREID